MESDVTLLVSYVVTNASWSPAYDVRVFPITKEMKVSTILGTINMHRDHTNMVKDVSFHVHVASGT